MGDGLTGKGKYNRCEYMRELERILRAMEVDMEKYNKDIENETFLPMKNYYRGFSSAMYVYINYIKDIMGENE